MQAASKRDDGGATQSLELTEKFYARPADIYEVRCKRRAPAESCALQVSRPAACMQAQAQTPLSQSSMWSQSGPEPWQCRTCPPARPSTRGLLTDLQALTDERRLRAFTQSEATSQPQPGGEFSMYGGSVGGRYLAVEAPRRLVQEWRFSSWPDGTGSQVGCSRPST